jgi:hypothetical protein
MIVQFPFQISQQISQNAPRDVLGAKVRFPRTVCGWRMRPDWYGQNCTAVDPGHAGSWDASLKLSTQKPIPGDFPIEVTINGAPFVVDSAEWQTTPTGGIVDIFTDGLCQSSFTDVQIAGSAEVFFSDNWICEYATEPSDLLIPAPSQQRKSIPRTVNSEILVPVAPEIIVGPVLGNAAQVTLQNLGSNLVYLIVCGAWGAAQFSVGIPDPASEGQLLGPGGSYIYSRLSPGLCIVADCPGGAQVAGQGTRVIVVDA